MPTSDTSGRMASFLATVIDEFPEIAHEAYMPLPVK
jgi:hypothetical protein